MSKEEEFDLNFATIRPILNMINDGLLLKIPSERLDTIATLVIANLILKETK